MYLYLLLFICNNSKSENLYFFTIYPFSLNLISIFIYDNSNTILLSIHPTSLINLTILPIELSIAFLLIFHIIPYFIILIMESTYIFLSIRPSEFSLSIHLILFPLSIILPTITPYIFSISYL